MHLLAFYFIPQLTLDIWPKNPQSHAKLQSYLPILHYDATLFRSVNRRILKADMIS